MWREPKYYLKRVFATETKHLLELLFFVSSSHGVVTCDHICTWIVQSLPPAPPHDATEVAAAGAATVLTLVGATTIAMATATAMVIVTVATVTAVTKTATATVAAATATAANKTSIN